MSFPASAEDMSLHEMVEQLSIIIGAPVTVESNKFELIAYSSHGRTVDPPRLLTILTRRVPRDVIQKLKQAGIYDELARSEEPMSIPSFEDIELSPRVATPVRAGDEILGYIWVYTSFDELETGHLHTLSRAAELIASRLKMKQSTRREQEIVDEVIAEILTSEPEEDNGLREADFQFTLPMPARVALIDLSPKDAETTEMPPAEYEPATVLPVIRSWFNEINWPNLSGLVHNRVVSICYGGDAHANRRELKQSLTALRNTLSVDRKDCRAVVAVSSLVTEAKKLPQAYTEARHSLVLGRAFWNDPPVVLYEELGVLRLFPIAFDQDLTPMFNHPATSQLGKYDQEHETDLVYTLETYLDCNMNQQKAAEKLNVHRNTLRYRLARIQEITGLDLEDPYQQLAVHLACKALKFQKSYRDMH